MAEFGPENRLRAKFPLHRDFASDRENPTEFARQKAKTGDFTSEVRKVG